FRVRLFSASPRLRSESFSRHPANPCKTPNSPHLRHQPQRLSRPTVHSLLLAAFGYSSRYSLWSNSVFMVCPNCGTKFHPGDSFCYGCGVSLPELTAAQGEPAPSQPSMPPSPESGLHSYAAAAPALAPEPPQQIALPQPQQSVPPPQQVAPTQPQQSAPPPPLVLGYAPPPLVADAVPQLAPVRYAGFMVLTLTVILCASIALLLTVQGIFMHAQKEIYLKAGPLLLVVVVLAKVLADQAGQIKAHPEPKGFTKLLKAA